MVSLCEFQGTGEEEEGIVVTEAVCNNFFEKFASTFQERDGSIGLGGSIVGFVRFGDDDDVGLGPQVVT